MSVAKAISVGRSLATAIVSNITAEAAVNQWIATNTATKEIDAEFLWFRPFIESIAQRLVDQSRLGMSRHAIKSKEKARKRDLSKFVAETGLLALALGSVGSLVVKFDVSAGKFSLVLVPKTPVYQLSVISCQLSVLIQSQSSSVINCCEISYSYRGFLLRIVLFIIL